MIFMLNFAEKIHSDIQKELETLKKNNRSVSISAEQRLAFTSNSVKQLSHLCDHLMRLVVHMYDNLKPEEEAVDRPTLLIPVDYKLQWTGSIVGLTEVIYAFHALKVFNDGNASLRMTASYFEKVFFAPLGNTSATFHDICQRKLGSTRFIDTMSGSIQDWIDRIDEKQG
jgi:hypothetical protein